MIENLDPTIGFSVIISLIAVIISAKSIRKADKANTLAEQSNTNANLANILAEQSNTKADKANEIAEKSYVLSKEIGDRSITNDRRDRLRNARIELVSATYNTKNLAREIDMFCRQNQDTENLEKAAMEISRIVPELEKVSKIISIENNRISDKAISLASDMAQFANENCNYMLNEFNHAVNLRLDIEKLESERSRVETLYEQDERELVRLATRKEELLRQIRNANKNQT